MLGRAKRVPKKQQNLIVIFFFIHMLVQVQVPGVASNYQKFRLIETQHMGHNIICEGDGLAITLKRSEK